MAIRIVQSKQNARVKELRATLLRPNRGNLIALEGFHLVSEAIASGLDLTTVFVAQGHEERLAQLNLPTSVELLTLPAALLAAAVTTETPQPIAALARTQTWDWPSLLKAPSLIAVLAGIQDPGNLGTILRSAEAFGATGAICLPGTVTHWNSKAMRASAGSVFRLPVLSASEEECFNRLHANGIQSIAAMAHDAQPLSTIDLAKPTAFIIGSEGSGISPEIAILCDVRVTIPCPGPVESLNAAVAASILLYEASKQRSDSRGPAR